MSDPEHEEAGYGAGAIAWKAAAAQWEARARAAESALAEAREEIEQLQRILADKREVISMLAVQRDKAEDSVAALTAERERDKLTLARNHATLRDVQSERERLERALRCDEPCLKCGKPFRDPVHQKERPAFYAVEEPPPPRAPEQEPEGPETIRMSTLRKWAGDQHMEISERRYGDHPVWFHSECDGEDAAISRLEEFLDGASKRVAALRPTEGSR